MRTLEKMKALIVGLLLAAGPLAFAGENLLANADFSGDGICGWNGWNTIAAGTTRLERRRGAGPDGADAYRISFPVEERLSQGGITLVAGEPYEASAWVRTSRLEKGVRFLCWNYGWFKHDQSELFPEDTHGKWQRFVWRFRPMESRKTYSFALTGTTPSGSSLEVSGLCLKALSDAVSAKSKRASLPQPLVSRIVPIDPLLSKVDRKTGEVLFFYSGNLDDDVTSYEVAASADGGKTWASAPLGADRRSRVRLGRLSVGGGGEWGMTVGVRKRGKSEFLMTNAYRSVLEPDVAPGPSGKRLNNFVTELLRVRNPGHDVRFYNPRRGWVYIGFPQGRPVMRISFRDCAIPIAKVRQGEPHVETMRYLNAGWHDLTVEGKTEGTELVVRAVKRLVNVSPNTSSERTDLMEWIWRADFTRRYLYSFCNQPGFYWRSRTDAPLRLLENAYWEERGMRIESIIGLTDHDPARESVAGCRKRLLGSDAWRQGLDITVDESGIEGTRRHKRINYSEAVWEASDAPNAINTFYYDAPDAVFTDPYSQATEIASVVNSGRGTGMLYPEVYPGIANDVSVLKRWGDQFARFRKSVVDLVPGAAENILYYIGTFIEPSDWTDWSAPEADAKVLYADLIRRIATDPAYGDPGGLAAGYFGNTDDDVARWVSKVVRYYAIEGGTEDLAARYGFAYLPGHLRNPDFAEGLKGWEVASGAPGSVQAKVVEGYGGFKGQNRKKAPPGTGDSIALLTRAEKPNVLSQTLTGLKPDAYYLVTFVAADEEDLRRPGAVTNGFFMARATVTGGEEIPELSGLHYSRARRRGEKVVLFNQYRVVFKAVANTARLMITDWKDASDPGAPLGRRTYVNFVNARKYYVEDESELEWLKSRRR